MQLKFDWLIVLENLHRGIMVTDVTLDGPAGPRIIYVNRAWMKMTGYDRADIGGKTPRILQGKHTDRNLLRTLKVKLLNREVFHGQTWNYRKSGQPFMMNWYCYAIYGDTRQTDLLRGRAGRRHRAGDAPHETAAAAQSAGPRCEQVLRRPGRIQVRPQASAVAPFGGLQGYTVT